MRSAIAVLVLAAALPAAASVPCFQLQSGEFQCVARAGDPKSSMVMEVDARAGKPSAARVEAYSATGKKLACTSEAPDVIQTLTAALAKKARVSVRFDKAGSACLAAHLAE